MKLLIIFSLLCTSLAVPIPADNKVSYRVHFNDGGVVSYESDPNTSNYQYKIEQTDGTIKEESGRFEDGFAVVEGRYQYVGSNGMIYTVNYVVDKNGYRLIFPMRTPPSTVPNNRTTSSRPSKPHNSSPYRPATTTHQPPLTTRRPRSQDVQSNGIINNVHYGEDKNKNGYYYPQPSIPFNDIPLATTTTTRRPTTIRPTITYTRRTTTLNPYLKGTIGGGGFEEYDYDNKI